MQRVLILVLVLAPFLNGLAGAFEPDDHGAACTHHSGPCRDHCPPKKAAAAKPCHGEDDGQAQLRVACGARHTEARLPLLDPAVLPRLDATPDRFTVLPPPRVTMIAPQRGDDVDIRPPRTVPS